MIPKIGGMGPTTEPSAEQPVTRTIVSDVRLPAVKATGQGPHCHHASREQSVFLSFP